MIDSSPDNLLFYFVQNQLLQAQQNQDLIEEEEYYESVSNSLTELLSFV